MTGFAGIYRVVYNYTAASEQELSVKENDLLYLIETADDGWWTVKKRVPGAASEEPEGIVPHNYIEPAKPEGGEARALYSYENQTDEELSFSEGSVFDIYGTDGDWVLVGLKNAKQFGFVPNNYIEKITGGGSGGSAPALVPAAAAAAAPAVAQQQLPPVQPAAPAPPIVDEQPPARPQRPQRTGEIVTDADAPPRPSRPSSTRPPREVLDRDLPDEPNGSGGAAVGSTGEPKHLTWPITDISGRRRVAKTLVVAPTFVTLINDDGGGRTQKWDVHDIIRYSSEKKHVFLDLENPTASLELKASSQSEADQIVSSLGQIVGAGRGGGLEEVLAAAKSAGHKQGQVVLDFKASNSKELSVKEFETVFVLNDSDKDWWLVRNVSGREGLIPRKFVHIDRKDGKFADLFRNKKSKDKARDKQLERDHESARSAARELDRTRSTRVSSDRSDRSGDHHHHHRSDRSSRHRASGSGSGGGATTTAHHNDHSLPDPRKMRLWVDRSGTFKVDAQLLGCSDGKVHLHKANGVKIAVPVNKLSIGDIEYVEGVTGVNLGDDKPLVDRRSSQKRSSQKQASTSEQDENNARYDHWLSFFLGCGVDPQNANRYAKNFTRDNMDESSLGDINSSILRTLGLREGDILRVTKKINEKLGRVQNPDGGLYSNEGGALQNNTGTTPANVDNQVWQQQQQQQQSATNTGIQPALQPQQTSAAAASAAAPIQPQLTQAQLTGALADLLGVVQPQQTSSQQPQPQQPQKTGALTGALTGQPLTSTNTGAPALQAQKTAEAQLAQQQRETQHQILKQQAELQKEQIRLLREQQAQLRRQQGELMQIQKTGSQLQALGPFATGVAQQSFAPSAASVLSAAPQPPQPRGFVPQPTTGFVPQTTTGGGFLPQTTTGGGAFGQQQQQPPTSFAPQTTGPFASLNQQRTGPFTQQPTGPFASQTTGPFTQQRTGPFVPPQPQQQQPTGPFAAATAQPTGPFATQQRTGGFPGVPQTGFPQTGFPQTGFPQTTTGQSGLPQTGFPQTGFSQTTTGQTGGFPQTGFPQTGFPQTTTGQTGGFPQTGFPQTTGSTPFTSFGQQLQPQPNVTGQLSGLSLSGQATGPFGQPQQQPVFGQPQQQQQQRTGSLPFQSQATGPFGQSTSQPLTSFGNQFQVQPQQPQQPFSQFNTGASTPFSQGGNPQGSTGIGSLPTNNLFQATGQSQPQFTSSFPQNNAFGSAQPNAFPSQPTGPFGQVNTMAQTTFGQPAAAAAAPQPAAQFPLQSQATGFGFGNQPQQQQQQQPQRANFNMASASNPFGL